MQLAKNASSCCSPTKFLWCLGVWYCEDLPVSSRDESSHAPSQHNWQEGYWLAALIPTDGSDARRRIAIIKKHPMSVRGKICVSCLQGKTVFDC